MPPVARQTDTAAVQAQVLQIVRELLTELGSTRAAESATLDSSLDRDLGLGSLERVELLVRCERRFEARLPEDAVQRAETPRQWVEAILGGAPASQVSARYRIEQPSRLPPPAPDSAESMVEVLRHHAGIDPERVQAHLLEGDSGQDISYRRLIETASRVAAGLVATGLRRDETVAIMLPTSPQFFYAFFGVMLAGGIAVPIYPPAQPDKIEEYVRRQAAILNNAGVRFLIGFGQVKAVTDILRLNLPSLVAVTSVEALSQAGEALPSTARDPSETAFIQYTSGSTGDPKGVVLRHSNILANIRGIGGAVKVRPTDVVVSWLPLYHDMGLIGSWLFSIYYGLPITLFSPLAFLSRPERWLWALHDSRGTLSPAPNFSYELCARKIPDAALQGLDLSAWRIAINAGEAVLPDTLERFARRFSPYGFRVECFVPCYGLAESSVALAFPPIERVPVIGRIRRDAFEAEGKAVPADPSDATALRFVANGRPMPGHEIKIVDDNDREIGERLQGRLLFRGPSKTTGYYANPEATAAITTEDGWMDSGDLAYWADGEIYITGRRKDLIIRSGRNIIPQEVESAASEVTGVRRGCVAAFGWRDPESGTERLIVVAETRATAEDELQRIEREVMERVTEAIGAPPERVELVAPHSIPKTSSGKIRRNETRTRFERGELKVTRRAPAVQIFKLWTENLGRWVFLRLRSVGESGRRFYSRTVITTLGAAGGVWARLLPGASGAWAASAASRAILALTGHRVSAQGLSRLKKKGAAVIVANRAGAFDPLVLAALIRRPFLFADAEALSPMPRAARFLLGALAAPPLEEVLAPPGGTLRQRIHAQLRRGQAVLVFPDGPVATASRASRFRLEAFQAAALTSAPIYPAAVQGTAPVLVAHERTVLRGAVNVSVGGAITAGACEPRELVRLRERVREAIARLESQAAGPASSRLDANPEPGGQSLSD
jgi:fatty-acyl-CoA synthase